VAELVQFTLEDGSVVMFESAESSLVSLRGGEPGVADGGTLTGKLQAVAAAAEQVAATLRSRLAPDQLNLEFGLKVSGEVGWWFFAKAQSEATIRVTVTWEGGRSSTGPDAPPRLSKGHD
jgi:hypothetical protein